MLYVPGSNDFKLQIGSHLTTRPTSNFGTTFTAAAGSYGSYVALLAGAAVTEDCYGILINVNSVATASAVRNMLVTIGRDPSGGTSYTDWLTDLNVGNASTYINGGGSWYYFPMYIRAGTSLAVKGNGSSATTGLANINIFGQPRNPAAIRVATKFASFGISGTGGTTITVGSTSDGAWTSLGTAPRSLWWWQMGCNANDTSLANQAYHLDLAAGDASNKKILIENMLVTGRTTEEFNNAPLTVGCTANVASGRTIYARAQSSTIADTGFAVSAYGCG